MKRVLNLLRPQNQRYIPALMGWELFSPVGLKGLSSPYRQFRTATQKKYSQLYPTKGPGYLSRYDWMRLELAMMFLKGDSLLDIGPYNGAFLDMVFSSSKMKDLNALDIERHPCLTLPESAQFHLCSVTEMKFGKSRFDTVTAMEIIEHLPADQVELALQNIREVAKERIILSLPFKEPHPLFKHDQPSGHKQSFDEKKIFEMFPGAFFTLAQAGLGVPWVIIIEDKHKKSGTEKFELMPARSILKKLQS